jgi:glutaredoxin
MIKYIIYTQNRCGHCESAKMILREAGETFEERKLDTPEKIKRFKDAGHKTVPQIFLHIGGRTELEDFMFGDVDFEPDIHLVEDIKRKDLKPTAKVIPFKGKIGAISGEKKDE